MFGTRGSWPGLAGVLVLACLVGCAEQEPSAPAVADADGPLSGAEVAPSAAQQGLREMIEAHANRGTADLPTEGASVEDPRSKVSAIELEGSFAASLCTLRIRRSSSDGHRSDCWPAAWGGLVAAAPSESSCSPRWGAASRPFAAFHEAQVCRDGKASRPPWRGSSPRRRRRLGLRARWKHRSQLRDVRGRPWLP